MSYVVTSWDHAERHVRHVETEAQARDLATKLRTRSDAMHRASAVPIRVMPLAVWERMQEEVLHPSSNEVVRRCRHRVFRLCIPCVSAAIARGE